MSMDGWEHLYDEMYEAYEEALEERDPFTSREAESDKWDNFLGEDHYAMRDGARAEREREERDARFWEHTVLTVTLVRRDLAELYHYDMHGEEPPEALAAVGRRLHKRSPDFWRRLRRSRGVVTPSLIAQANDLLFPSARGHAADDRLPCEGRLAQRRELRQTRGGGRRERRCVRRRTTRRATARAGPDPGDPEPGSSSPRATWHTYRAGSHEAVVA